MIASLAHPMAEQLVRRLPGPAVDRLAVLLARAAFHLRVPARRAHDRNLARLAPECSRSERRRLTCRSFEHFALGFTDFLRLEAMGPGDLRSRVRVAGVERLARAEASDRGVVLLSAHLGNWEWGAAYLASRGRVVHLAARPHQGAAEAAFSARRSAFGVRVLPARGLFTHAARALRAGEWVAVMGDRAADTRRSGSVCGWAAALAQRTRAWILPTALVRVPRDGHVLLVGEPLEPGEVRLGAHRSLMRDWLRTYAEQWAAFEPLPEGLA